MTNEEFFNIVKGKRIRWSNWPPGKIFVPDREGMYGTFSGTLTVISNVVSYPNKIRSFRRTFNMADGFEDKIGAGYWKFDDTFKYIIL